MLRRRVVAKMNVGIEQNPAYGAFTKIMEV